MGTPRIEPREEDRIRTQANISISMVRQASLSEWDKIWNECSYSTYFHSREWAEIWSNYSEKKMLLAPFMVFFSDGKKALLPFSCLNKRGLAPILTGTSKLYVSSPECTYGGWISTDKLEDDHARLLFNLIKKTFCNISWRLNPYDEAVFKSGIRTSYEGETHAINLKKGIDAIQLGMSKGHRHAVNRAIRNGVTVRISSSIQDWLDYYQVYEDTITRWGNRLLGEKYSWKLFHDIFQRKSDNIELWLATHSNVVISGCLCFHSRMHYVSWHSATIKECLKLNPANLVRFEIIKRACEKGYEWFDFNPSAGLVGVQAFKEGFGAKPLRCPIVIMKPTNIRTKTIEKVSDKVIAIKKLTRCTSSVPILKNILND